jgi:hypothetical protein
MRLREFGVLAAALGSGCSLDPQPDMPSPVRPPREAIWGGQTGSLQPKCGLSVEEAVPEGSSGIVVDVRACAREPTDSDVQITSETGEVIEVEWIPLGGGRYLVRPAQSLERGQYQVSVGGSSQSLQVGAASSKPTRLGTLERLGSDACDLSVDVRLDEAVLPYVALLHVDAVLDGDTHVLADFGALTAENTTLPIRCSNCLSSGRHSLVAFGEIAGEPETLETATLTVESACSEGAASSDSDSGCVVARVPSSGAGGIWGVTVLGLLMLLRRGRSEKRRRIVIVTY